MTTEERVEALRVTLGSSGWTQVIKPALTTAISGATLSLVSSTRADNEKNVTDDALKGRIIALNWVQNWEDNLQILVEQLEAVEKAQLQAVPSTEGGSPYS